MIRQTVVTNVSEIDLLLGKEAKFANLHYVYDAQTIDLLKKNFQRPDSLYLMTKDDDRFVAFCSIDSGWWEPNQFFLREIFVMPAYQGQHIGADLMRECIQHAWRHGAAQVVTETAFENLPMRGLCESMGFTQWENPQWKDGITYKLAFSDKERVA